MSETQEIDLSNTADDDAADTAGTTIEQSPPPPPPISSSPSPLPSPSPSTEVQDVTQFYLANVGMNIDASLNRFMDALTLKLDTTPVPPPRPPSTSTSHVLPPDYQQLYIDSLLHRIASLEQTVSNQHGQMMLLIDSTAPTECAPAPARSVPVPAPAPLMPQTVPAGNHAKAPPMKAPPPKAPPTKVPPAKATAARTPPATQSPPPATPKNSRVEIIGDSILHGIRPWSKPGFYTKVNSFSGATTTDIVDMADIAMRRKPDMLIVHAGTNDFGHNVQTKKELQRVISKSRNINPDIIIGISAICYREDDRRLQPKIKDMNNQLKNLSRQMQVKFIEHDDFDSACLAKKGLHPNDNGNVSIKADFDRTIQSSLA